MELKILFQFSFFIGRYRGLNSAAFIHTSDQIFVNFDLIFVNIAKIS